ncbi:MAG: hypothetical protein H0W72_02525 [Planctomycetes bacterium]|nr:hypothetical protein [Planctomycetota bacterium]
MTGENPYVAPLASVATSPHTTLTDEGVALAARRRWSSAEGSVRLLAWSLIFDGMVGALGAVHEVLRFTRISQVSLLFVAATVALVSPLVCGCLLRGLRPSGRRMFTVVAGLNALAVAGYTLIPIDGRGFSMLMFIRAVPIPLAVIIALWWGTGGVFDRRYREHIIQATPEFATRARPTVALIVVASFLCNLLLLFGLVMSLVGGRLQS